MNYKKQALYLIGNLERSIQDLEVIRRKTVDEYDRTQIGNIEADLNFTRLCLIYNTINKNGMFGEFRNYTADNIYSFSQDDLSNRIKQRGLKKSTELNEGLGGNYKDDVWGFKLD